jgi:ribosomal protein S20
MAKLKTGRHTSALKELRKSLKRRKRNLVLKNKIKETKKQLLKLIDEKKVEEAKKMLQQFYKVVDKAAKVNYIHKNKAARLKSDLTKKLNSILSK